MAKQIGIVNVGGQYLFDREATFLIGQLEDGREVFVAGKPRGTARRVATALKTDQVFLVCDLQENEKGPQPFKFVEPEQVLGVAQSFGSRNMIPYDSAAQADEWVKMLGEGRLGKVRVPNSDKPTAAPAPTAAATPDPAAAATHETPAMARAMGLAGMKGSEEPATEPEQSTLIDSAAAAKIIAEGIKALRPITGALVVTDQEREALQEAIGARFPRAAFDSSQAASAQANLGRVIVAIQGRRRQAAEIFFAELASFCEGNMALQLGLLSSELPMLDERGNPVWGSTLEELLAPVMSDRGTEPQPEPPPDPEGDKPEDEAEAATAEEGVHPIAAAAAEAETGAKAEEAPAKAPRKPRKAATKTAADKTEKAKTGTDG